MEEESSEANLEKIVQMINQRPPQGQFREQLFWMLKIKG